MWNDQRGRLFSIAREFTFHINVKVDLKTTWVSCGHRGPILSKTFFADPYPSLQVSCTNTMWIDISRLGIMSTCYHNKAWSRSVPSYIQVYGYIWEVTILKLPVALKWYLGMLLFDYFCMLKKPTGYRCAEMDW